MITIILTLLFAYVAAWLLNITIKTLYHTNILKQWLLIGESVILTGLAILMGLHMPVPKIHPSIYEKGLLVMLAITVFIFISFTIVNLISFIPKYKNHYHFLLHLSLMIDLISGLIIAINPSLIIKFLF